MILHVTKVLAKVLMQLVSDCRRWHQITATVWARSPQNIFRFRTSESQNVTPLWKSWLRACIGFDTGTSLSLAEWYHSNAATPTCTSSYFAPRLYFLEVRASCVRLHLRTSAKISHFKSWVIACILNQFHSLSQWYSFFFQPCQCSSIPSCIDIITCSCL